MRKIDSFNIFNLNKSTAPQRKATQRIAPNQYPAALQVGDYAKATANILYANISSNNNTDDKHQREWQLKNANISKSGGA